MNSPGRELAILIGFLAVLLGWFSVCLLITYGVSFLIPMANVILIAEGVYGVSILLATYAIASPQLRRL